MDEKELKTSKKQRFFIGLIAFVMIGSMIASYAGIVIGGNSKSASRTDGGISEEKMLQYEEEYNSLVNQVRELSASDFEVFSSYRSEISAYNETSANINGVQYRDLKDGTGRELEEDDYNYLAYYVGWCADGEVFDSSFDDDKNPTGIINILDASDGLIEGMNSGVIGMRLGGVREITIAGELAYKDQLELCGGYYKPLKFLVMPIEATDDLRKLASDMKIANEKVYWASYGIDYEEMINSQN